MNRFKPGQSPSPVDDKLDAARELLYPAIEHTVNPLSLIPDAYVEEILFTPTADGDNIKATGVKVLTQTPWSIYGNTLIDPCDLGIGANVEVTIAAENVILCAGTIGSTRLLAQTAITNPLVNSPRIGKGLIMHPSLPIIGRFDTPIDLVERNLQFTPNRTFLTAAHLQATNKIGPSPETAVVSTTQRLWNTAGEEIPNVFVRDSSIFPTSVGANPMQSIYTFAKIFSDRLLSGC